MFRNKKIAIWGRGKEGEALLKYCVDNNLQHSVFEGKNIDLSGFDVLFKSPGVSLYNDSLKKALSDGVELWSGTNVFMSQLPSSVKSIAVSGTKGKSTTSSLLVHILRKKGFKVNVERITGKAALGCGYAIILYGNIVEAEKLLRENGVKILEISEK